MKLIKLIFVIVSVIHFMNMQLLPQQTELKLMLSSGPGESVGNVEFSPNGKILASSNNSQIILWDAKTFRPLRTLVGTESIKSFAFSPDGQTLAVQIEDFKETIQLWDINTSKKIWIIETGSDTKSLAFSPDGKYLATGGSQEFLQLYNAKTGKKIRDFKTMHQHPNPYLYSIFAVSFSPDGKTLASGSTDQTVDLWDIETGNKLDSLKGHNSNVFALDISPNGKFLASAGSDGRIIIWNFENKKILKIIKAHHSNIKTIAFSPNSQTLVTSGENKKTTPINSIRENEGIPPPNSTSDNIKIWDVKSGKNLKTLKGHKNFIHAVDYSPDGKLIVSAGNDETIRLWDTKSGKELKKLKEQRQIE